MPASKHWRHRVLMLALPIIAANLTQPLLGAVDTAIAGHLPGAQHLGGVALGSLFFSFVFWGFGFLRMGTTGLVAQAYGANEPETVRLSLIRALLLAAILGGIVLALRMPLLSGALAALGGSDAVRATALAYCEARIWAAPFALANYAVLGYLLGVQRVRLALTIQIFINIVNIIAALLCVYGFNRGVAGLGTATAIADVTGFLFGGIILWQLRPHNVPPLCWRALLDRFALRRLIALNFDIFIRTLCLLTAFAWFARLGARQGDTVLAANALLLNFQTFMAYGLDGFAHAAEALVGAAIGARNRSAFRHAVRAALFWAVLGAMSCTLIYWIVGPHLITLLTDQLAIQTTAKHYLFWAALAPIVSVWGFLLDGVFIGATRTRILMRSMAISLAIFVGTTLLLVDAYGNHGLWFALLLFMTMRGVTLARPFFNLEASIADEKRETALITTASTRS